LGLPAATRDALLRAALTMNIGMSVLQDQLAQQEAPVSEAQREEIAAHPQAGVALLRSFGITDPLWLEIVRQHHDAPEGSPADVLHVADLCVARISPRRTRSALSPADALRLFYADHATEPSPLARTLLAEVGMFPPGSYVHLASNETAVVTGLGQGDVPPPVLALADRNNEPLVPPRQRDTGDIRYRIRESLAPDLVPPGCAVGARLFDYF
jgi:HD-GYP domain-containing protein (c-di-GMP phosphodiesterase class II)